MIIMVILMIRMQKKCALNKFGKVNQESRLEKIIKFLQWKKNEDNYISYFSKKRTMYSDLNSGMKPEQLLPEEFLVASTVMGLDKNIQKVIFSWVRLQSPWRYSKASFRT